MIDDPISQLERELATAATRIAQLRRERPTGRWARRWRLPLVALPALAAVAAGAVLIAMRGEAPTPSLTAAAYAQVSPRSELVYLKYETRRYSGGRLYQRALGQVWYTATKERSIGTSLAARSGRPLRYLEVTRDAHQLRSYESGAGTLTTQANCRQSGRFPRALTVDPLADFRSLYQHGRVTQRGTATFDGRRVTRLVANEGDNQLTYLVTPRTGEPVALKITPRAIARLQTNERFTGSVVRFLAHTRQPLNASTRGELQLRPHRAAHVIHLGRRFCPHP